MHRDLHPASTPMRCSVAASPYMSSPTLKQVGIPRTYSSLQEKVASCRVWHLPSLLGAFLVIVHVQGLGSDTPQQLPREDSEESPGDVQRVKDGARLIWALQTGPIIDKQARWSHTACFLFTQVLAPGSACSEACVHHIEHRWLLTWLTNLPSNLSKNSR